MRFITNFQLACRFDSFPYGLLSAIIFNLLFYENSFVWFADNCSYTGLSSWCSSTRFYLSCKSFLFTFCDLCESLLYTFLPHICYFYKFQYYVFVVNYKMIDLGFKFEIENRKDL